MSEQANIMALLEQGINKVKSGARAEGRDLLNQVVDLDPGNEKAWFWLASAVDDEAERIVCLGNVVRLNPNNTKAKEILATLQAKKKSQIESEEVVPGITRKQLTFIGGGAIVVVLVLVVALLGITNANNQRNNEATAAAIAAINTSTAGVIQRTGTTVAGTATQLALASPTLPPTNTPNIATLPPAWTATPLPTQPPTRASLPPPSGLTGLLAVFSGRDTLSNGYLSVGSINLEFGNTFTPFTGEAGREPRFFPNGQRVIYTRYDNLLYDSSIDAVNTNGSAVESIPDRWLAFEILQSPEMASYSDNGGQVTFIATPPTSSNRHVFTVSLDPLPADFDPETFPSPLRQLTTDNANYSHPSFSPDGTRVVAIREPADAINVGSDIVWIDVATGSVVPITNDYGTFTERQPRYTPDGSQIVYAAASAIEPNNFEIHTILSSGTGSPTLLVRDPANDQYPVLSPDARHLAFASDRSGAWDIYILDINANQTYQLTSTDDPDYPTDWWMPS